LLHKQHHSITITFLLRKLSCINILPKTADQTKKATLVEALTR
jgi:hypothetical protein